METRHAVDSLAALAQETRLRIFRLLVEQGPQGLPAGEIARRLGLPPATMSFHIKELAMARLVSARQKGRFIHYATDFAAMRELLGYLVENCCRADADAGDCTTGSARACSSSMPDRPMPGIPKPNVRLKWRAS